jgi:hypothetical protein
MNKHVTFFVILALSLGVLLWIVKAAQNQQVLGVSTDPEIESLQRDINGL